VNSPGPLLSFPQSPVLVYFFSGGAGAVGVFAVSFAKWGGAEVVATVGSEEQAETALDAGADHVLN
jgi:NADPH2:quinone reductase